MEQLTWSPWSLQTSSRSSPYQCQTWAAAALLWLHQTGQHYLRLVTQLSQHPLELLAFQISHLNFWFLWLQWLESYWKLLPFFAPSLLSASQSFVSHQQKSAHCWTSLKPLSWKFCTAALPGASFLFVYLYTEVSFQYIYPDVISPENTLRNDKNVFSQFLKDTPIAWAYFYFSSLDFFKRMHTNDTELVLLCPRTKSYCLFEIPKICSTAF